MTRLALDLVIITLLMVIEIKVEARNLNDLSWVETKEKDESCADARADYYVSMENCLEQGLVVGKGLEKEENGCFKLHSQGPCNKGEILVFAPGRCLLTQCVENRDRKGTPCVDGWFSYNGTCTRVGSRKCGGEFGRRVRPDVFGDVQCVCDRDLGFIEMNGKCHFEFLQGPCRYGEQLIVDTFQSLKPRCVINTCPDTLGCEGFMLYGTSSPTQPKYICILHTEFKRKHNVEWSLFTSQELDHVKEGLEVVSEQIPRIPFCQRGVFDFCKTRDRKTGRCVKTEPEPEYSYVNFLFDIRKAFNVKIGTNMEI